MDNNQRHVSGTLHDVPKERKSVEKCSDLFCLPLQTVPNVDQCTLQCKTVSVAKQWKMLLVLRGGNVYNRGKVTIIFFLLDVSKHKAANALLQLRVCFYVLVSRSQSLGPPSRWHHARCERRQAVTVRVARCSLSCLSVKSRHGIYSRLIWHSDPF